MSAQVGLRRSVRIAIAMCAFALPAAAQVNTGQLVVTMTLQSSISLIFRNATTVGSAGFCALTNADTNNVNLDLGQASFAGGDSLPCVGFATANGNYTVSSGFDVVVSKANTTSASYQLAAQISSAPPANVTWLVNNATMSTAFTTLTTTNAYDARIGQTVGVRVKSNVPAQTLSETITFLATAN